MSLISILEEWRLLLVYVMVSEILFSWFLRYLLIFMNQDLFMLV